MEGKHPTAGVTGKGGIRRTKPPDAESAVGAESRKCGRMPALACPDALAGGVGRGVGRVLKDAFEEFELDTTAYPVAVVLTVVEIIFG